MISQPLVFFFIPLELLFLVAFLAAIDFFQRVIQLIRSLDQEKRLLMHYILTIYRVEKTFTERKVMNRIKDIRFSFPVIPCKAIHTRAEGQFSLRVILKIEYGELFKVHRENRT